MKRCDLHSLVHHSFVILLLTERGVVAPAGQGLISSTTLSPVATHGLFSGSGLSMLLNAGHRESSPFLIQSE
jgi:hypothetical protein